MSQYKMEIRGFIGLSDYSSISDYIGLVDNDESVTVILDEFAQESLEIIESLLKKNDFLIMYKGLDEKGKYCINAQKCDVNKFTM